MQSLSRMPLLDLPLMDLTRKDKKCTPPSFCLNIIIYSLKEHPNCKSAILALTLKKCSHRLCLAYPTLRSNTSTSGSFSSNLSNITYADFNFSLLEKPAKLDRLGQAISSQSILLDVLNFNHEFENSPKFSHFLSMSSLSARNATY